MTAHADGYAAAFFEVARAEGVMATVEDELLAFSRAMEANTGLAQTLADRSIPAERRLGVVNDLLAMAHPVTANLVSLVVGADRGREFPEIVARLLAKSAEEKGKVSGEVRSATPLSLDQQQRLTAAVEKATGKKVELKFLVDPAVLGGVVTTIGDIIIDGTIRTRLDQLKDAL